MKKKFLSIALCALALAGVSASAQTQQPCNSACTNTYCTYPAQPDCQGTTCSAQNVPDPFAGISLTADQQSKLQTLKQEKKAQKEANAPSRQELLKRAQTEKSEARKNYLNEVKSILTPEQYVIFLENAYVTSGANRQSRPQGKSTATKQGTVRQFGTRTAPVANAEAAQ